MTRQEALTAVKNKYLETKDWQKKYIEGEVTPIAMAFWQGRRAITAKPRHPLSIPVSPRPRRLYQKTKLIVSDKLG